MYNVTILRTKRCIKYWWLNDPLLTLILLFIVKVMFFRWKLKLEKTLAPRLQDFPWEIFTRTVITYLNVGLRQQV